jgi:hypothetical protein
VGNLNIGGLIFNINWRIKMTEDYSEMKTYLSRSDWYEPCELSAMSKEAIIGAYREVKDFDDNYKKKVNIPRRMNR